MGSNEKLYSIWYNMKRRCHNPKDKNYSSYGSRGISVCDDWRNDYRVFEKWALAHGYQQPSDEVSKWDGLSIDRIDPRKGYSPENCQWIPLKDNLKKLKRTSIQGYPRKQNVFLRMPDKLKKDLLEIAKQERESLNTLIVSVMWAYAEEVL